MPPIHVQSSLHCWPPPAAVLKVCSGLLNQLLLFHLLSSFPNFLGRHPSYFLWWIYSFLQLSFPYYRFCCVLRSRDHTGFQASTLNPKSPIMLEMVVGSVIILSFFQASFIHIFSPFILARGLPILLISKKSTFCFIDLAFSISLISASFAISFLLFSRVYSIVVFLTSWVRAHLIHFKAIHFLLSTAWATSRKFSCTVFSLLFSFVFRFSLKFFLDQSIIWKCIF